MSNTKLPRVGVDASDERKVQSVRGGRQSDDMKGVSVKHKKPHSNKEDGSLVRW